MIPRPPIHAVNCRHIAMERDSASMSVSTLAPVVEKPDIDSNRASTGLESCGSYMRYGRAPNTATRSHTRLITR